MFGFIALIIFIISLGGIVFIIARKVPALVLLPQNGKIGLRNHKFILNIEEKIKNILLSFEKQIILHKILSWLKCLVLKIETQIDHLLHGIRKKAKEKKEKENKK